MWVLSVTLFFVIISGILGEQRAGKYSIVDYLLFADDLAVYTTTRNLKAVTRVIHKIINK